MTTTQPPSPGNSSPRDSSTGATTPSSAKHVGGAAGQGGTAHERTVSPPTTPGAAAKVDGPMKDPDAHPTGLERFEEELLIGGATETDREPVGGWQAAFGMLAIAAFFVWLGMTNVWYLLFALALVFALFMHELGHYSTARLTGMKVTQFFIGFGPRIWSFRRGETEYGVRALPLGAFVSIIGMNRFDEVPAVDESRTYRVKSFPRRLLVISAGSLMHMMIAIVVLFGVYAFAGRPQVIDGARVAEGNGMVTNGAAAAGIEPGDVIIGVGNTEIKSSPELGAAVRSHRAGETVTFSVVRGAPTVDHGGELLELPVTLGESFDPSEKIVKINDVDVGDDLSAALAKFDDGVVVSVGIADPDGDGDPPVRSTSGVVEAVDGARVLAPTPLAGVVTMPNDYVESVSVPEAAVHSVGDIFPAVGQMVKDVFGVFDPSNVWGHLVGTNDDLRTRPTTFVGAGQVSAELGQAFGAGAFLFTFAMLNVFIGAFNMFPLLPLDGGHAAIAVYERIRELLRSSKQRYYADVSKLVPLTLMVVFVLGSVFIAGLYLDIARPL